MHSKPLTTLRVTNIDPKVQKSQLCELFRRYDDSSRTNVVLCSTSSEPGSTQTATVTFDSEAEAKAALMLNGTILETAPLEIDSHFMGLTVLAGSSNAKVEYNDTASIHGVSETWHGCFTNPLYLALALSLYMDSMATHIVPRPAMRTKTPSLASCGFETFSLNIYRRRESLPTDITLLY